MAAVRKDYINPCVEGDISSVHYTLLQLEKLSIDAVFMVPGKMIQPFMNGLTSYQASIQTIVAAHETGAGFMAEGYARVKEHFGVCFAIAGPGTYNLAPALAAAFADETPVLAIGGSVPAYLKGAGAFQDSSTSGVNNVASLVPITTSSHEVAHEKTLPMILNNSIKGMFGEKRGPSYVELPVDIQNKTMAQQSPNIKLGFENDSLYRQGIDRIAEILSKEDERTVILLGSRARNKRVQAALVELAEHYELPVATTLCSKGTFPEDHPLSLGVFGFAGNCRAHEAILRDEVDNLILLGVDLDQRNSLAWTTDLIPRKQLVRIDVRQSDNSMHFSPDININNHCAPALEYLALIKKQYQVGKRKREWLSKLAAVGKYYNMSCVLNDVSPIHPGRAIVELRSAMPRDAILAVDSGVHRVFAAHYWQAYSANSYLTSSSMAPMGWAISAIIGAQLAEPGRQCVAVTGDGCMLMHGNEIQTAARYNLPIIYVVLNNSAHGGIHVEADKKEGFSSGMTELPQHDWAKYAESLGLKGFKVSDSSELRSTFQRALDSNSPCLVEIIVGREYKAPNYEYLKRQSVFNEQIQQ